MRRLTKKAISQTLVDQMAAIMSDNTYAHPEYRVLQVECYENNFYVSLGSRIDTGELSTWMFADDRYGKLREASNFGQWKFLEEVQHPQKYFVRVDFDHATQEFVTSVRSGPNHFDKVRNEYRYETVEEADEKAERLCRSFHVAGNRWFRAANGEKVDV